MEYTLIAAYCVCDDVAKALVIRDDPQCRMSTSEIMFFGTAAALLYGGNIEKTRRYLKLLRYIPKILSHSRLNRRLLMIEDHVWRAIFVLFKTITGEQFVIDSFPMPACHPCRSWRCRIFHGKEHLGYCAAKKMHYYGLKVHLIVSTEGVPIEYLFTPASWPDIVALKDMEIDLPEGSYLYGDKAYNSKELEDLLIDAQGILLLPQRKLNSRRPHSGAMQYLQRSYRKRIETAFSKIARILPRSIPKKVEKLALGAARKSPRLQCRKRPSIKPIQGRLRHCNPGFLARSENQLFNFLGYIAARSQKGFCTRLLLFIIAYGIELLV